MGNVVDNKFELIGNANNEFFKVETSGEIESTSGEASDFANSYCKQKLIAAGYDILTTEVKVKPFAVGDIVPNWQSYVLVP